MSKISAFEAKTHFGEPLQRVERAVEKLRQLQQRIRRRSRGRFALSAAEVRTAIGYGRS
jgi:hypothetical protein